MKRVDVDLVFELLNATGRDGGRLLEQILLARHHRRRVALDD